LAARREKKHPEDSGMVADSNEEDKNALDEVFIDVHDEEETKQGTASLLGSNNAEVLDHNANLEDNKTQSNIDSNEQSNNEIDVCLTLNENLKSKTQVAKIDEKHNLNIVAVDNIENLKDQNNIETIDENQTGSDVISKSQNEAIVKKAKIEDSKECSVSK